MASKTNRNSPAYWEEQLRKRGLSMDAGFSNRVCFFGQTDFEAWLSAEGNRLPDLKDVLEYKRDHLEAA